MSWKRTWTLEDINQQSNGCAVALLGIQYTELGEDYLVATMPVDERTKQPFGLLHGGASVLLAETVASMAANMMLTEEQYAVGLDINANHLKSVTSGLVTATAKAINVGKTIQVWEINICNDSDQLVCVSRMTAAVLNR